MDESKPSVAQRMYDVLFKKKYKKEVKPEALQAILESNKHFKEVFNFSKTKRKCNSLNCELTIRNDYTDLSIMIFDSRGNDIVNSSSRFKTGFERAEFLSDLKREINKEAYEIYKTLCEE